MKVLHLVIGFLYGAETWAVMKGKESEMPRKFVNVVLEEDEKKISRNDRVRNEDVLRRVKEERNILHAMKRRKANWIGHILRRKIRHENTLVEKLFDR